MKHRLVHLLLSRAGIQRVHIVGCARSGTTMLHYGMAAFENTMLMDSEGNPWNHPSVRESVALYRKSRPKKNHYFFVTKRPAGWWQGESIQRLCALVRRFQINLVTVVRDPRDVLVSKHPLDREKYYVSPDRLLHAMAAIDRIHDELAEYPRRLTVRYEDVVCDPASVQNALCERFGMKLKQDVSCWSHMKDNLALMPEMNLGKMEPYTHKLRNFDAQSIGRWRLDEEKATYVQRLLQDAAYGQTITSLLGKYHYNE